MCQYSDPKCSYHCFYLICAATTECLDYLATWRAIDIIRISYKEQDAIFRFVAAIIHLGKLNLRVHENEAYLAGDIGTSLQQAFLRDLVVISLKQDFRKHSLCCNYSKQSTSCCKCW
ncbi:myosin-17-like [Actinidia eriantha]|uniref:myosin-17-like n=1 Tax=Actinidia eriantha TaxID=165200 RepID=UPI00258FAB13|nr:myosin-17-like [Actinidia eriantha]XP_057464632.1 myosin-17-like [Actinidia eriantha]XP_057464633.1 myosin-17-like [Actinidia eriantha]